MKSVLNFEDPKSKKEVQKLTGRLAALIRFILKSSEKFQPFFNAIIKEKNFHWIEECKKALQEVKEYLTIPPLVIKVHAGDELFLYLAHIETSIIAVLAKDVNSGRHPIYFVSRILAGANTRI